MFLFFFLCSNSVESSEESSEAEESGNGSGDFFPFNIPDLSRKERESGPGGPEQESTNEVEGSGFEVDYSNYITPELVKPMLSAEDLREDNIIE